MANEEPIIEEEPRMVFVSKNRDGTGYSAHVSPAVTKKDDLDALETFFGVYHKQMMDAAERKVEGDAAGANFVKMTMLW